MTNIKNEVENINSKLVLDNTSLLPQIEFTGLILRGVYINQINELLNFYKRSDIYITITDWWHLNYESELNNIQKFLGLEVESLPMKISNKRDYFVEPFNDEAKKILIEFYKPFNKKLFDFLGFEIPEWIY